VVLCRVRPRSSTLTVVRNCTNLPPDSTSRWPASVVDSAAVFPAATILVETATRVSSVVAGRPSGPVAHHEAPPARRTPGISYALVRSVVKAVRSPPFLAEVFVGRSQQNQRTRTRSARPHSSMSRGLFADLAGGNRPG